MCRGRASRLCAMCTAPRGLSPHTHHFYDTLIVQSLSATTTQNIYIYTYVKRINSHIQFAHRTNAQNATYTNDDEHNIVTPLQPDNCGWWRIITTPRMHIKPNQKNHICAHTRIV